MQATAENMLQLSAQRWPEQDALVVGDTVVTYRELDNAADAVAGTLIEQGLQPGDRVTLFSENRWEWVAAYHGIARAGGVINPVNSMLTAAEFSQIASNCQPRALIASETCLSRVSGALPEVPTCQTTLCFDRSEHGSHLDLSAPAPAPRDYPTRAPGDLFSISYTSGTTGAPKGAMQSMEAVTLNWAYTATMHGRTERDRVLGALPLPHVYGNSAVNSVLLVGGTVLLEPRFDPERMVRLVGETKATMVEGVPAMYAMMIDKLASVPHDFTTLTRSTVGGQTIATSVVERWETETQAPLVELWGMTELSGLGVTHAVTAPNVRGSIGVAMPGTEVRLGSFEDPEVEPAPGSDGELMVRGPLVTMGYLDNEQATRELIEPSGWMHTGDVARREGAHFFVVDRLKDMILTGGYNVYPAEIERVLSGHPQIALVGVGKAPDDRLGEVPHAFVVAADGAQVDPEEVLAFARQQLAPYKLPRQVHVVPQLPTTTSGKIKRRELVADRAQEPTLG